MYSLSKITKTVISLITFKCVCMCVKKKKKKVSFFDYRWACIFFFFFGNSLCKHHMQAFN